VHPSPGWPDLARRAFATVGALIARLHHNPRPLVTIKDAAYAWRHVMFFMAMCEPDDQATLVAWMHEQTGHGPDHAAARLAPVLTGLRHVMAGGDLDDGSVPSARRFLGWSAGGHWMSTGAEPGSRPA
jgi:hypothetical protein